LKEKIKQMPFVQCDRTCKRVIDDLKLIKREYMTGTKVLGAITVVVACISNTTMLLNLCLLPANGRTSLMRHYTSPLGEIPIFGEFILQLCYYIILFVAVDNSSHSLKFCQNN
jgi:hypothetical protein